MNGRAPYFGKAKAVAVANRTKADLTPLFIGSLFLTTLLLAGLALGPGRLIGP